MEVGNNKIVASGLLDRVPQAPEDLMFGLSAAFRADSYPNKVDVGVGAYRDDDARPFILPSVKKAKEILHKNSELNHEYLPISGLTEYVEASQRLVFGSSSAVLRDRRVATVQTLSGTGALHLGAAFLARFYPKSDSKKVWTTTPAYVNHVPILEHVGLKTGRFPYYSPLTRGLDFDGMISGIERIPDGSILLLHACAHNPTGVDPTKDQWRTIAQVMKRKCLLPFFDSAYQGFASGDVNDDVWAIRHFIEREFDTILVAQSYAKNMGLYGERAGCLHIVTGSADLAGRVVSQLKKLQRVDISTPPAFGARVVATILNDRSSYEMWLDDLRVMSGRIKSMREQLKQKLIQNGTPGDWAHVTDQVGMFCYSGLTANQMKRLRDEFHVYGTPDGRFSISGLNSRNLDLVAEAVKVVVCDEKTRARL